MFLTKPLSHVKIIILESRFIKQELERSLMFDIRNNYKISRDIAAGGMVLLKNEGDTLPFSKGTRVGIVGKDCLELIKGGGGSASVKCEYTRTLLEGLQEKADAGKLKLYEPSFEIATTSQYELSELNALAENIDAAIVTIKRYGTEGTDMPCGNSGDEVNASEYGGRKVAYHLYRDEIALFDKIEASNIKKVVLLLNISSTMDLSFIDRYPKIQAVLLTYLPGMECGSAIADILSGDVTPSGKLVDTIPYAYCDLPSAASFNADPYVSNYEEDIFVGYRYFETYAKDKVLYPFGFGLSYTAFEYKNCAHSVSGDRVTVCANIRNIGSVKGREVAQVYVSAPRGALKKPNIILTGYAKTAVLHPGESETVSISFPLRAMASFDDSGAACLPGAWVLESGAYEIFIGASSRDLISTGDYYVEKTMALEQLSIRFDGRKYEFKSDFSNEERHGARGNISLYDVQKGKLSLKEFVELLSPEELVWLARGQAIGFPSGTSGIGDIRYLEIPNPQTADGPVGIRRSVNSTCFPCGTLVATSWDSNLQEAMGAALGMEGFSTGLDIILGPALNIHRNPLGGRCFEYFSEDPVISGKTAAALVRGIEKEGLLATLKHYAANNCECNRNINNSIVSERALREIYLRGFEIAVKESNPACIMTSYNLLNGIHTSAHAQLLRGILRDEWNYEGALMTDWRNGVPLKDEIAAGNNIKMPLGYPDEAEKALLAYKEGTLSLAMLKDCAYYVLLTIMKSRSFKQRDFGLIHKLEGDFLSVPALAVNGISCARVAHKTREDGKEYFYTLNLDQRNKRTYITYAINCDQGGMFELAMELATDTPDAEIWIFDYNGSKLGKICCQSIQDENNWQIRKANIALNAGTNILKFVFALEPTVEREFFSPRTEVPNEWADLLPGDIRFTGFSLERKESSK